MKDDRFDLSGFGADEDFGGAGTFLRGGSQEDFYLRLWEHHCTDIPTVHDDVLLTRKRTLKFEQLLSYGRDGRCL